MQSLETFQAIWAMQPRAMRLFTPALKVCWENMKPAQWLEQFPLFSDGAGRIVALPPRGPARNAWPVKRALEERQPVSRNYRVAGPAPEKAFCVSLKAYIIEPPGEGPLIVEETERIDTVHCHDERLRYLDEQFARMMGDIANLLFRNAEAGFLQLRLPNPNLQSCHQIKKCRRRDCPAHKSENPRCWEIPGTLCPQGEIQLDPVGKFHYCNRCPVYLLACPDPLTRVGESFNRLLSFLQFKYQESIEMYQVIQQSELLAAIGELTISIVHEIKNPISVISTRLDCLSLELESLTREELAGDLDVLRHQVGRMRLFLEGLLTLTRPGKIQHQALGINEVILNTLPLLVKTLEKARIRLENRLAEGLPAIVGCSTSIQQVLLNLLLNARDAIEEGGTILIGSHPNPADPAEVQVEVRDSGCGIPAGELGRIFSPYYSTKLERGGNGLGLAICSRIMSQHGGRIDVKSRPGRGTTFTLTFKAVTE